MSKKSNSPKRFDATEIRNLTLDEIDFVTGGSKGAGHVSISQISITKTIDKASIILF